MSTECLNTVNPSHGRHRKKVCPAFSASQTVCVVQPSSGPYATPNNASTDLKGGCLHPPPLPRYTGGQKQACVLSLLLSSQLWFLCFDKVSCRPDWPQTHYSTSPVLGLELCPTTLGCKSRLTQYPPGPSVLRHALFSGYTTFVTYSSLPLTGIRASSGFPEVIV